MGAFTTDERMALLLNVLGDEATEVAFDSMNPDRATSIKGILDDFKLDPPTSDEIEYVIGDFNQYFRFALQEMGTTLKASEDDAEDGEQGEEEQSKENAKKQTITYFPKLEPSGDPIADLNALDPYQVATAIGTDHPKTVAMVLRHMETKLAASAMEFISDEVRSEVIVFISQESTVPAAIVNQVLKSTVAKAMTVEFREEKADPAQVMAELMRSLPKEMRVELMPKLEASDEKLASEVKAKLYLFEDVMRLDDRDIQKVLGEVESDSLIVALQRTDEELVQKLLGNLSKRARESIAEEMQYKEGVSDEEIEEARSQVVVALAKLDESGEIKLQ